jgi:YgiT-type zinc finger domain-containing protein
MINPSIQDRLENSALCIECQAGVPKLRYLTYFTWLDDELITVPNFPSYVCDVCGRREYDGKAITWLNTILNPETGHRRNTQSKSDAAGVNPAQT